MASSTENEPTKAENADDFECNVCGSSYPNSWELLIHQEMHTEEKLTLGYQCQDCGTRFALERQLNRHVLSHSEELKPFKCKDCPSRFRLREHLDVHTRKHDTERPFACEQCGYRYEQKTHLMSHMKSHTDERPYVCDICQSAFKRSYDMKVHRSTHTQEKPFRCEVCGSDFKKLAYLTKHKKTHTTDRFRCNQCAAVFKEKRALVGHIRLHSRDKNKSFVCHICHDSFPTSKQLHAHVKIHPSSESSHASSAHSSSSSAHSRAAPNNHVEEKTFHCYQCGCSFGSNNPYQLHKSLQHDGETPYQCQFCTAAFTQDTYLTVHTLKHVEKKLFCERCKTYCDSEYEMGLHEWKHVVDRREARHPAGDGRENESSSCSGGGYDDEPGGRANPEPYAPALQPSEQKRYNCEHCGCLFHLLKPLELHKALQHEGPTPHECHWCTAAFTQEHFLKVHIYKHLEKRVTCPRCKILCRSEYELAIHECRETESEQPRYHCANCGCSFATANPFLLHETLQHEGVAPHACRFCQATFTREKFLNVHLHKHAAKKITCSKCGTVCVSEYEMGLHEWHHAVLDKLNTTVQPSHAASQALLPPRGLQGLLPPLLVNQELSITLVYSADNEEKPSQEAECRRLPLQKEEEEEDGFQRYYYSEPPSLEAILLSSYQAELARAEKTKRYHCQNCGCSFGFLEPYRLHVSLQHDGETPFACDWCAAQFTKEIFLNVHSYKHLRKRMTCRVCRAVCHSEYEMALHEWEHDLDHLAPSPSPSSPSFPEGGGGGSGVVVNSEIEITPVVPRSSKGVFKIVKKKRKEARKRSGPPKKARVVVHESPASHVLTHAPEIARKLIPKRRGRPPKVLEMVVEPEIVYEMTENGPYEDTDPAQQPEEEEKEDEDRLLTAATKTADDDVTATYGRGQRNKLKKIRNQSDPGTLDVQPKTETAKTFEDESPKTSKRRAHSKRKSRHEPEIGVEVKTEPFEEESPNDSRDHSGAPQKRGRRAKKEINKEIQETAPLSPETELATKLPETVQPAATQRKRGAKRGHSERPAAAASVPTLRRSSRNFKANTSEKGV